MKILITGANGMLAKAVRQRFKEHGLILTDVVETENIRNLDITDEEKVVNFAVKTKPEIIINCAAYTAVDKAEEDLELARKINADGPKNLAIAAKKVGAKLVHISTDYVFGGDLSLEEIYKEDDPKAPVTAYGITKLEGEEAIKANTDEYYIFRTAWLIGDGKNFIRTMINAGKQREEVTVVCDQHGSPTFTATLAEIVYNAIEKQIPYGIYHATNLGFTTWYDFTKKAYELAAIDCKVLPITSEEYTNSCVEKTGKVPANRPKNSMLSKEKLLDTGIEILGWENALERYLKEEGEI